MIRGGKLHLGASRWVRRAVAFASAAVLAFAAVADNAAACPGEGCAPGPNVPASRHDGAPAPVHACSQNPCQTPTLLQPSGVVVTPAEHDSAVSHDPVAAPLEAELPAPPTPPPTALA